MQIPLVPRTAGRLIIVLALTAFPACRQSQGPDVQQQALPSVQEAPRTAADVLRLVQEKNQAIAELEGEAFEASIALFEDLAVELPDEPLVATNLVVAYILLLKSPAMGTHTESWGYKQTADRAEQASLRLLQLADKSAASHVLASKIARLRSDENRMLEELNRAAELAPADPIVWYELFQAARHSEDARFKARAREALERTYELWPDNLGVLRDRLLQQASDHDATLAETLAKTRETVEPLIDSCPSWQRLNLLNMIDQAAAALAGQSLDGDAKWNTVLQKVRPVTNVLSGEHPTRIDRRRIDRQDQADQAELAFVKHDFGTTDFAAESAAPAETAAPIPVKLVPLPHEEQLPERSQVRSVELVDFDLDGRLDVVAIRGRTVEVFSRGNEGRVWRLLTACESPHELCGAIAADLDRDVDFAAAPGAGGPPPNADWDLIAYGPDGLLLLENVRDEKTGNRGLKVIPPPGPWEQLRNVLTASAIDLDHDGDLDLAVSSDTGVSLWSNRGGMAFDDLGGRASLPPPDFRATALLPVDWNCDGDVDLLLAGTSPKTAGYLANGRHGHFRWEAFSADYQPGHGAAAMCLADVDGNRSWDLIGGGEHGIWVTQTALSESGLVGFLRSSQLDAAPVLDVTTWDYDNDGCLDLLAWGKEGVAIYRGDPCGQFHPALGLMDVPPSSVQTCQAGDVDGDGDWDLLVVQPERLLWYANQGGNQNHWLDVNLRADPHPSRSPDLAVNMHGLGSLLEVKTGLRCQRQLVTRSPSHFGLGACSQADVVRVLWTNGKPCNTIHAESNQVLLKEQKHEGM